MLRATPLYTFLWYCDQSPLEKIVLDCGAGGARPPLIIFHEARYQTIGLEISDERLQMARQFEEEQGIQLDIRKGDIRQMPLPDESVSFLYSFNTVFHMTRADIARSIQEFRRVLKPDGLCFTNFLSIDDEEFGVGEEIEAGTFLQSENGEETLHTYFQDQEGDALFAGWSLVRKEKRILDVWIEGERHRMAFLDYIAQKNG